MTFAQDFEARVKKTIDDYNLLSKDDKVIVACSGGKDSTTILYLLSKWGYDVEGLTIDLRIGEWSKKNVANVKSFCESKGIKLNVIDLKDKLGGSMCFIRSQVQAKEPLKNCTICGIIKRYLINKGARDLKATKVVTGHNVDDEAESVMMNLFRKSLRLSASMGPRPGLIDDPRFVPRVKPLFFCSGFEVRTYSKEKGFPVEYAPCPCSVDVFRRNIRDFLRNLEKDDPDVQKNIVNAFMKLVPKLREKFGSQKEIGVCDTCGEPSSGDKCQTCRMLGLIRS